MKKCRKIENLVTIITIKIKKIIFTQTVFIFIVCVCKKEKMCVYTFSVSFSVKGDLLSFLLTINFYMTISN